MKLQSQSMLYLSVTILAIVTIWAALFYWSVNRAIKRSLDEGLENYKRLIIEKANADSTFLENGYFDESFFTIQQLKESPIKNIPDAYIDTMLLMQDRNDVTLELEPVRMLITTFYINGKYYELKVANSIVEKEDLIRTILLNTIGLYIILISGIIFINNIILKRLWNPFYNLLNQLKDYKFGTTKDYPLIKTKTQEFIDLQKATNILLKDNKRIFEQQKLFIGNASHELQTPLTIAINKLELLLETKNLDEHQVEDIAEVYQIIERMIRLNKSLLLLSKIENKQFENNEKISMNEIINHSIHALEDFASFKKLSFTVKESSNLIVEFNPNLAEIVISNLLRNAIFHNIENGHIEVSIEGQSIIICNSGINSALEKEKLFTQFYKFNSKGSGLGLSIVMAILNIYNLEIKYQFKDQQHCFQISF